MKLICRETNCLGKGMFYCQLHDWMSVGGGPYNTTTLLFWLVSDLESNQLKRYDNG